MSFAVKRRVVRGLLLFLAVWPLVHRGLVEVYDISPWRLFGWAMYCRPILSVNVGLVPEDQAGPMETVLPAALERETRRFTERRLALGRLADPAPLASAALAQLPRARSVIVVIQHNRLDPWSDTILGRREYFRFARADGGVRGRRFEVRELGSPP